MKQVLVKGKKRAGVAPVERPRAKGNWVVVKVHAAPMCTEYKAFAAGANSPVWGHEAAGEVVEVAQPGRVKVGDRVVVMPMNACGQCALCLDGDYIHCENGFDFAAAHGSAAGLSTMAQYLLKQDWMLLPIPDGMTYAHASMACCGLGPTFGALQLMAVDRHDTLLITGLGPVGLGGVVNGVYRGARVIGVDSIDYRAEKALDLGAAAVVNPLDEDALQQILDLTSNGRGVDAAVDCSGVVAAHRLCIDAARRKGQVAFVGECSEDTPLRISPDMIRKGLKLIGSWHFNLADSPRMMKMIGEIGDQLDKLITHRYAIDDIQNAWETQLSGQCGKVILQPWEGSDV
ncbi:MAG: zinc-binding dehydrogenase [Chloroflexota bacterium]|nr:zinc-binding dehydrogenase [Chloroflexota bacterium]MDE2948101.1 zinc-binding dehydrogenase [Chloroflexota bacterium]